MILRIPCKAGTIQLIDDERLQITQLFGKVLWEARYRDITGFASTSGTLTAVNVTIQATTGAYLAELVTRKNYARLQAAFPHLQTAPIDQAWYLHPTMLSHVATYDNPQQMATDIAAATANGWIVQSQSAQSGHVSTRKIIAGGLLAGGLGAFVGAGRSKDQIMVTFMRSPEWLFRQKQG